MEIILVMYRNYNLYLLIKGARVPWFGSSIGHFVKKTLPNSVNQPAIQSLVTLAGLLPRLSRRRRMAPLPSLPQTVPTETNGTTPIPATDQERSWRLEACGRGQHGRHGRHAGGRRGRRERPAACGRGWRRGRRPSLTPPQTRRPRWRELGWFQAGATRLEVCGRGRHGRPERPAACRLGRPAACGRTAWQAWAAGGVRARTAAWPAPLPSPSQTRRPRSRELAWAVSGMRDAAGGVHARMAAWPALGRQGGSM
jgi:hypothetical protein